MNIEEIKAREQAATPGPWMVDTDEQTVIAVTADFQHIVVDYSMKNLSAWGKCLPDVYFIAHARTDIPALIAEVERLQKIVKLQKASCSLVETVKSGNILDENATLKKQTGLMAKYIVEQGNVDINLCDDIPNELHLKYQPKNDGDYENGPCIQCVQEHFRQQVEQLTHETQEAEK